MDKTEDAFSLSEEHKRSMEEQKIRFRKLHTLLPTDNQPARSVVVSTPHYSCKYLGDIIPMGKLHLEMRLTGKSFHDCKQGMPRCCTCECKPGKHCFVAEDSEEFPVFRKTGKIEKTEPMPTAHFPNPREFTEEAVFADIRGPEKPRPLGWQRLPGVQSAHRRLAKEMLDNLPPYDPSSRSGSGIILIGGGRYDCGNYIHGKMVRFLGCNLPIQVWHRGDDEEPVSDKVRSIPGVTVVDATKHPLRQTWRSMGGWQMKIIAVLNSGYQSVICSDSDNYPIIDPTTLISMLTDHPAILYPDILHMDTAIHWESYGFDSDGKRGVQGGCYVFNVEKAWRALKMTEFFDSHSEFYYKQEMSVGGYGEQDQVRAAFRITDTQFLMMGSRPKLEEGIMIQFDKNGRPAWIHRIAGKPAPIGAFSQPFTPRPYLPMEKTVWQFFAEYTGIPCLGC